MSAYGQNPIVERIWALANRQNRNALVLVCGPPGIGKSYACLKLALAIQSDWTLDNLVFRAKDFLRLVNSNLRRGSVIIWDECGVEFDSRTFYSVANRLISYTLETFRHRNLIVFFNVPSSSMVDLNLRRLFHYQFEAVAIDYEKSMCIIKPLEIENTNRYKTKTYFKYPRIRDKTGRIVTINRLEVGLPPEDITEEYEKRKTEFTTWLNRKAEQELMRSEQRKEFDPKAIDPIVEDVKRNIDKYTSVRKGSKYVNTTAILGNFDIGDRVARRVKAKVEEWMNQTSSRTPPTENYSNS